MPPVQPADASAIEGDAADRRCVAALLAGDATAIREVGGWIRQAATPYRDLWRGELEDLEQEALLALLESLRAGRFRGRSSLRTYARMLVHHRCIDRLRAARRRPTVGLDDLELASEEEPALVRLTREESVRVGLAVLARTSEACRELWRLLLAGRSYRDMAAELAVAEGTLRVRVLRCRRRAVRLRDQLLGAGGNEGGGGATLVDEEDVS